jgi:hypothetical protein
LGLRGSLRENGFDAAHVFFGIDAVPRRFFDDGDLDSNAEP